MLAVRWRENAGLVSFVLFHLLVMFADAVKGESPPEGKPAGELSQARVQPTRWHGTKRINAQELVACRQ